MNYKHMFITLLGEESIQRRMFFCAYAHQNEEAQQPHYLAENLHTEDLFPTTKSMEDPCSPDSQTIN